jgi:hypothetical protein
MDRSLAKHEGSVVEHDVICLRRLPHLQGLRCQSCSTRTGCANHYSPCRTARNHTQLWRRTSSFTTTSTGHECHPGMHILITRVCADLSWHGGCLRNMHPLHVPTRRMQRRALLHYLRYQQRTASVSFSLVASALMVAAPTRQSSSEDNEPATPRSGWSAALTVVPS